MLVNGGIEMVNHTAAREGRLRVQNGSLENHLAIGQTATRLAIVDESMQHIQICDK